LISYIRGRVASTTATSAVIEVGGVGMLLHCTPSTLADLRIGEEARIATSMVVREDSMTLYGFATEDERDTFEVAQTASGVGPKVAQAMVAVLDPDQLRSAIAEENTAMLTKVPGIGKKGAQRIVLELKDRLGARAVPSAPATAESQIGTGPDWRPQVHSALVGLGWSSKDADSAVAAVVPLAAERVSAGGEPEVSELLRAALRTLSKT